MSFRVSFVLVFFSPFSIAITSLGEERANLSAFRTFVRFVIVWICRFPLPLGVWERLRFVIVTLPGLFSYLFFHGLSVLIMPMYEEYVHCILALFRTSVSVILSCHLIFRSFLRQLVWEWFSF